MSKNRPFPLCVGHSVAGRPLAAIANFDPATTPPPAAITLLLGGIHGNEPATVRLIQEFVAGPPWAALAGRPVIALPVANPDGCAARTRYNLRGVDLNRNFPYGWRRDSLEPPGPEPFSEPESRALRALILDWRPTKIVSLHWALAELDADGPQSTGLATAMWQALSATQRQPYRLRVAEIGRGGRHLQHRYSQCPGSLGQWCGYGVRYPDGTQPMMLTLELPYDPAAPARPDPLPDDHLDTVHATWNNGADGYVAAAAPAVFAMLAAAAHFTSPPDRNPELRR